MLSLLRERGEAFVARRLQGDAVAFSARIPGGRGRPLCELKLEAATEPEAGGKRLRLRAHLRLRLAARDMHSWVELRSSTAALDDGSRALVPERLAALGITPAAGKPVQTWAGALGGARPAFAMLTLMQFDKERLPLRLQRALGPRPLHLTATLANVVEDA